MLQYGPLQPGRQCRKCRRVYPPDQVDNFFSRERHLRRNALRVERYGAKAYKAICNVCLQNQRDARKRAHRFYEKARDSRRRHAERFSEKWGRKVTTEELERDFGWDLQRMAHDLEYAFGNGCLWCGEPLSTMHGGLMATTLDIHDPRDPPFYGSNTRWICRTDNSKKGEKTPAEYAEINRRYQRQLMFLATPAEPGADVRQLPLFDPDEGRAA